MGRVVGHAKKFHVSEIPSRQGFLHRLHSKRFRLVSEQRKTDDTGFSVLHFWPREK